MTLVVSAVSPAQYSNRCCYRSIKQAFSAGVGIFMKAVRLIHLAIEEE
jgi:hypothetical protein